MEDDNLELKKRSRRRLVGAAALALLAAIVLPMVMDQEPAPPAQDIQVSIPDREADGVLSRPIAGRPQTEAATEVVPAPQEQPAEPATSAAPAPAPERPARPAPNPAPVAAPTPTPDKPVAAKPPTPAGDEAARVRALLGEGGSAPTAAAATSFVVQVGAFGDPVKAQAVTSDLKARGFGAYTEKAGNVTRVRVGPFSDRAQADKAAARLAAAGMNAVVAPR